MVVMSDRLRVVERLVDGRGRNSDADQVYRIHVGLKLRAGIGALEVLALGQLEAFVQAYKEAHARAEVNARAEGNVQYK